jgi:hypothetical protein
LSKKLLSPYYFNLSTIEPKEKPQENIESSLIVPKQTKSDEALQTKRHNGIQYRQYRDSIGRLYYKRNGRRIAFMRIPAIVRNRFQ